MAEPEPETEFDFRQTIRDIPQFVQNRADQQRDEARLRAQRMAEQRLEQIRTFARGLFQRTSPQPAQTSPIQVLNRDAVSKIGNFL